METSPTSLVNPSDVVGACGLCTGMQSKKKKNKNLRNPNIVLRLRRTGGIFTLETR